MRRSSNQDNGSEEIDSLHLGIQECQQRNVGIIVKTDKNHYNLGCWSCILTFLASHTFSGEWITPRPSAGEMNVQSFHWTRICRIQHTQRRPDVTSLCNRFTHRLLQLPVQRKVDKCLLQRRTVIEKKNKQTGGVGTAVPEMCETNDKIFLLSAAVRCTRCRKHKQKLQ